MGDLLGIDLPMVAAGMAVGRIGCLLTEPPGTPTHSACGIVLDPATAARPQLVLLASLPVLAVRLYAVLRRRPAPCHHPSAARSGGPKTTPPEQPPQVPDGSPPAGPGSPSGQPPGMPPPWGAGGASLPAWSGGSAPPPPKESSRPIWGGVLIVLAVCLLGMSGLFVPSGPLGTLASLFAGLAVLFPVVAIVLLFPEKTRRWALGMLLGYGVALVVAFVGCIGLIVAYSQSSST